MIGRSGGSFRLPNASLRVKDQASETGPRVYVNRWFISLVNDINFVS